MSVYVTPRLAASCIPRWQSLTAIALVVFVNGVRQARAAGPDMVQQLIAGVFQLLETVCVPSGAPEVRTRFDAKGLVATVT